MTTKSRQDSLAVFLRRHLSEDSLGEAMEVLEPFYRIVEAGRYELVPQSEAEGLTDKITLALKGVFGDEEVQGLAFLSLSHPFPDQMTEEAYQASLRASLCHSLEDRLEVSLEGRLEDNLRVSLEDSLRDSLEDSLRDSLGVSLRESLCHSLRDSLGDSLRDSLWASLFYYLGLAIAGEQEKTQALKALVEILPHCIPIGTKKDQPKVWIVVCG